MDYFDLHCDTPGELFKRKECINQNSCHISLQKADYINRWIQCMAVWIPDAYSGDNALDYFEHVYYNFLSQATLPGIISGGEMIKNCDRGFIITVEGGRVLGGTLEHIKKLADMNVKVLTLTWNGENEIGGGADTNIGITPFGKSAVEQLEKNNIIIDISHASDKLFYDVCEYSKRAFIATHSNSRKICNHKRNLTDEQFGIIRDIGGIVGLNFCKEFITTDGRATMEDLLSHAEHFLSLGGEDVIALGSDFDGADMPCGISGIESMGDFYELFLRKNYSETLTRKIFFDNAYNFFINNI